MSDEHELVIFRTVGEAVAFDPAAQMWSLTAMHKASGAPANKEPAKWLRGAQATELLEALYMREAGSNVRNSHIWDEGAGAEPADPFAGFIETRRGNGGGTWAHWQIAAAYAHYLNPAFYLQWNEWAMSYRTGQQAASDLAARVAALEARMSGRTRSEGARVLLRRTVERIVEEVELHDVPQRPLSAAIRAVLRQAGRPLRPIEVTALLQAAGVDVRHPTQVSGALWHLCDRHGEITRDADGRYALIAAA